jgi:iron uptake system component EfeO
MRTSPKLWLVTAGLLAVSLAGCSDSSTKTGSGGSGSASGGGPVTVLANDTACKVADTSLEAGIATFAVKNEGAKVTEFYVYAEGDRIMGEVENIGPGLTRELRVELASGKYQTACKPGMLGKGIRGPLTVAGEAAKAVDTDTDLKEATAGYSRYVASQSKALVEKTTEFVNAVKAGKIEEAKALFPVSRTYWERIEPVAEIFGDLDPQIDGREADLEAGVPFTGYHRLEKDLWVTRDVSESGPTADKLLVDVKKVVALAAKTDLTPLQLANGSKELLDEVATGKITGEEDIFSHTDLWDFRANVDGSKAAIAELRPVLLQRDAALVKTIDTRFAAVDKALDKHIEGDGFKFYTQLTRAEIRELAATVDALGEPISKVAVVVAKK